MILAQLAVLAVLIWALWRMRPYPVTYFTQDFELRDGITVTLNGKELKQGKDYTVAADNVIVFTGPEISGEATVTWRYQEPI